jgi:hypothetical protein
MASLVHLSLHGLLTTCPLPGRWIFGDGEQVLSQFKPPYDESFQVPDPTVAQVLVEHNTTHTYAAPGEGQGHCFDGPELGQPSPGDGTPLETAPITPTLTQPGLIACGLYSGEGGAPRWWVRGWIGSQASI